MDKYAPWRRFVTLALAVRPDIHVIAEAVDGATAIQKVTELHPDVVVMDIRLPDVAGIEVARQIRTLAPTTKILFLTEICSEKMVKEGLSTGAYCYVVKLDAARDLLPAMEALLQDDYFVSLRAVRSPEYEGPFLIPSRCDH